MLNGAAYPSLDRLARSAVQQLHTAGALVSLVAADRRVLAGYAGTAPRHSFCRMVVDTDAPLLICDARTDERVAGHPAIADGMISYAGFPVRSPDGLPLAAFGVLDNIARDWEPRELLLVEGLAAAVEAEVALRIEAHEAQGRAAALRGVLDAASDAYIAIDLYGVVTDWTVASERLFGYPAEYAVGRPVADLIIPERFRAAHAHGLARLHSGGTSTLAGRRVELTAHNRSGKEFPIEMTLWDGRDALEPRFHAFLHDISERVEQRRQLEHERTFLQALLDSLAVGVAACDENGTLTLFNTQMRTLHGTDARPLGAPDWAAAFDLYAADGSTPLRAEEIPLARAFAGESVEGQELVVAPREGRPRSYLTNGRPIVTASGDRIGAVVSMLDVTDQRRSEFLRELRLTVARALAEATTAAEAADRTVATLGAAMGWTFGEFWQADDDGRAIRRVGEWSATGRSPDDLGADRASRLRRGEGLPGHIWAGNTELWITDLAGDPRTRLDPDRIRDLGLHTAIGVPVRSGDRILGVLIFLGTDVQEPDPDIADLLDGVCAHLGRFVERRRAEDLTLALAAARRDLDRVIERVEDYVWTVEILPNRRIRLIYGSSDASAILGGPITRTGDALDTVAARLHPDDEPIIEQFFDTVAVGRTVANEVRVEGIDGKTRWVWSRAVPRWEGGRLLVDGISTNVTDRHVMAEERERLLTDQKAQNQLKDELVALVSHELRNPLGVIRSYGETLLDDPDLTPEQRHLAEVIDQRSAHMQTLVDDLLDMARLEAGQLHIDPKPLSLVKLIRDVVSTQEPMAFAKDLTLMVEAPRHLTVEADPVRLRQVLDNLVSNAIKYTPPGGRVTVTARHMPPDGYGSGQAVIEIADTGIGIPADQYPHLFDRFFRASNAVRQGIKGTGLGLAITRAILEAHGGRLSAEPAPTGGSLFTVILPAL